MGRILKSKGFSGTIIPSQWEEDWAERKHCSVSASDGSILEITCANEYIRIVASDYAPKDKPYAAYRFISEDHPTRPKTEFYCAYLTGFREYMSKTEVTSLIALL